MNFQKCVEIFVYARRRLDRQEKEMRPKIKLCKATLFTSDAFMMKDNLKLNVKKKLNKKIGGISYAQRRRNVREKKKELFESSLV